MCMQTMMLLYQWLCSIIKSINKMQVFIFRRDTIVSFLQGLRIYLKISKHLKTYFWVRLSL